MFPKPEKNGTEKGGHSDAHQKRNPIHRRNQGMQKRKGTNAIYQKNQETFQQDTGQVSSMFFFLSCDPYEQLQN